MDTEPKKENPEQLTIAKLHKLFEKITDFDGQFDISKWIGRLADYEINTPYAIRQMAEVATEMQATFTEIESEYRDFLTEIGLEIELEFKKSEPYEENGEHYDPVLEGAVIGINVQDGNKLIEWLRDLNKVSLDEKEKEIADELAATFVERIHSDYHFDNFDNRFFNLFEILEDLIGELKKIRGEDSYHISVLEKYYEVAKKGYLREYIEAESYGFITISRSERVNDHLKYAVSTKDPNYLERTFKYMTDFLKKVKDNSKATEFHVQLKKEFEKYLDNLEEAIKFLPGQDEGVEMKEKLLEITGRLRGQLQTS